MMLIEPEAVARIDQACIASGIDGYQLMNKAGRAVAAAALRDYPGANRFVVLAGPGNNGGDGYVAAGALRKSGADVVLYRLFDAAPTTRDAARAAEQCGMKAALLVDYRPEPGDVVIDALFGAGLARDLPEMLQRVIDSIEACRLPVIAIDMPSGICGRRGAILGRAFRADLTITFMAHKPGQFLLPGRIYCGRIEVADIGTPIRYVEAHRSATQINAPEIWRAIHRNRGPASHKYSHGALMVFSGDGSHSGAARLAASAGLKAGAGLVSIAAPADALSVNANHLTAVMLRQVDDVQDLEHVLADRRISTFVLGPAFGSAEKARDFVLALSDRPLVLDADGITAFKDQPDMLFDAFAEGPTRLVLTPHDGEFRRLFPDLADDQSLSKVERAQKAAARAHGVVIFKGADTVIAAPDGRSSVNINAPPWLATAGSGDVLAGICGALRAQGLAAFEAACAAVYLHGEAANRAGSDLTAETLINFIHSIPAGNQ